MSSVSNLAGAAARMALRETVGRAARLREDRTRNLERLAALLELKPESTELLELEHFRKAAVRQDWSPAALHAISDVESAGKGYDDKGRLVIAVEPHIFSIETNRAWDVIRPDVSYPKWIRYRKGGPAPKGMSAHPMDLDQDGRWEMFAAMGELSFDAACAAISAGRFQQLGRGWDKLGFSSAEALIRELWLSEAHQLAVMIRYFLRHNLGPAVKRLDWRAVAKGYNGSGQVDWYAGKMAERFKVRQRTYA